METSDAAPVETAASPEAHEPPPAPAERSITPAPEDFANPPPMRNLLWPVFWCAVAALLIVALRNAVTDHGWPVPTEDAHAESAH